MNSTNEKFKVNARLITELGDELIRNEKVALLELVKNSYDADSSICNVSLKNIDAPLLSEIIIEDDGSGMDLKILQQAWLVIGTTYKRNKYLAKELTPKYKRLPIGEKGIGRFGAHKLGDLLQITSRKDNEKEVHVEIDWRKFETAKNIEEITVTVQERDPEVFIGKTGTKLTIGQLKNTWTTSDLKAVYQSLMSLHSPFNNSSDFKIQITSDTNDWMKDLPTWNDIKKQALFKVSCSLDGKEIKEFRYEFVPPIKDIKARVVDESFEEIKKKKYLVNSNNEGIDLKEAGIGEVRFEALIYDRDSKILKLELQNSKYLTDYLDNNGGVRVYRDGIRIYDYGEQRNDWLNLDKRRVNMPTKRISNNIILGAVYLHRKDSAKLVEKTNREGFVENKAYISFRDATAYIIHMVETLRRPDKELLREHTSPTTKSEPVLLNLEELGSIIDQKVSNKELKKELKDYVKKIEIDYKNINEILLRSAGAGLSLSVVVHEVEKITSEIKKVVKNEKVSSRLLLLVRHLSELVEGYSILIRSSDKKKFTLKELIKQALFNVEFRLKTHDIKVIQNLNQTANTDTKVARNLFIGVIMNIIDNSIWWLDYAKISQKRIYISTVQDSSNDIVIVIADNGNGFTLPKEEMTKPFVSGKPDGMGLGLHIASEIMKVHGGQLFFPEKSDFDLPKEFRNGAIVAIKVKIDNEST